VIWLMYSGDKIKVFSFEEQTFTWKEYFQIVLPLHNSQHVVEVTSVNYFNLSKTREIDV